MASKRAVVQHPSPVAKGAQFDQIQRSIWSCNAHLHGTWNSSLHTRVAAASRVGVLLVRSDLLVVVRLEARRSLLDKVWWLRSSREESRAQHRAGASLVVRAPSTQSRQPTLSTPSEQFKESPSWICCPPEDPPCGPSVTPGEHQPSFAPSPPGPRRLFPRR